MVFIVLWYNFYGDIMFETAIKILNILEDNNYNAYIVGGFVRDKLLNINSSDIDIITNARPEEVSKIFNIDCNDKFGCIILKKDGFSFEITTFRKEQYNINSRKPYKIEYINDLKEDLLRRDFTINSICIDKNMKYIDLLNGLFDINSKNIRVIGNSDKKIYDDPLRILRAIRFSSIYDFSLDNDLILSIKKYKNRLNYVSFDRIKSEFNIIFKHNAGSKCFKLIDDLELNEILLIKHKNTLIDCDNYIGMWAQLSFSDNYNFSKEELNNINIIKHIINNGLIDNYTLYKYDINLIKIASKILGINKNFEVEYENLKIHNRKDINIRSYDIIKISNKVDINKIYIDLEKQILYNNLKNKKRDIISYIINKY